MLVFMVRQVLSHSWVEAQQEKKNTSTIITIFTIISAVTISMIIVIANVITTVITITYILNLLAVHGGFVRTMVSVCIPFMI